MAFGSQPEVETCRPRRRLHPLGYYVSQHVKVMDAIEAAADNPKVTASPGPTLGDFLVPALRRGSDHSGRTNPLYRSAKADPGRRFHALRDKVIAETSCGGRGPRCAATTAHRASTRPPWPMSRSTVLSAIQGDDHGPGVAPLTVTTCRSPVGLRRRRHRDEHRVRLPDPTRAHRHGGGIETRGLRAWSVRAGWSSSNTS
jgi:hypothetical protein